jgi:serine/threonine protein kinase
VEHARIPLASWRADLPGNAAAVPVELPAHLDHRLPNVPSRYQLRTTAEIPDDLRGKSLTLSVPHMPAMASLEVDGAEAVPVGTSAFDVYRASGPQRWRIPADATRDGSIDLELDVHHTMSRSGWFDAVPFITTDPLGGAGLAAVHAFNTLSAVGALAASVVVSLLYGFLFLSLRDRRRRSSYGWFAIGATCGMVYPAFILGITQPVLGVYEAPFMMVALVLGSNAAMWFSRAYVGAARPSGAWWGLLAAVVVLAIAARDPFLSITVMATTVVAVTIANACAQLVFVARLRRSTELTAGPSVYAIAFAWPATVLLALPDVLAWLGQGEPTGGLRIACVGIMALSLYQATTLSREHLSALKRADDLVAELAERVRLLQTKHEEINILNHELRRQIAARSRELAEKLASMDDDGVAAPPPALDAGTVVEGRYRVVKPLGAGGMGAVYEVERATDNRHFALKALSTGSDAHARARFAREAQIVANVSHPNVVSIVDVDVAKSGFIFLVMELVEGGATLHEVRRRHRDIPWTLGVLAQVAEGLDAIHAAGVIHRDLKPGNVLLSRGADGRRPSVKITDFGISSLQPEGRMSSAHVRARPMLDSLPPVDEAPPSGLPVVVMPDEDAKTLELDDAKTVALGASAVSSEKPDSWDTQTGVIFGTVQYMAQELSTGTKGATRSSDIFSLGIIAFELLTGKRPFGEAPVQTKLNGRIPAPAPPIKHYCPTLPPKIAALLDRAMSHDPRARPTATELAAVLRESAVTLAP